MTMQVKQIQTSKPDQWRAVVKFIPSSSKSHTEIGKPSCCLLIAVCKLTLDYPFSEGMNFPALFRYLIPGHPLVQSLASYSSKNENKQRALSLWLPQLVNHRRLATRSANCLLFWSSVTPHFWPLGNSPTMFWAQLHVKSVSVLSSTPRYTLVGHFLYLACLYNFIDSILVASSNGYIIILNVWSTIFCRK